jgi:hypothetical protein
MPELMLMYRAAAFLIRTYAPEISMGLRTDDEIIDMGPAQEIAPRTAKAAEVGALLGVPAPPQPATTDARTLADFRADVDNATDADTAMLALDAARTVLDAADQDELAQHWRKRWPQE